MKLEQSFEVKASIEEVWSTLIDIERVAPCLPGAAVTGRNDDGSYNGTFSVKIGPTSASYAGKLQMEDVDEAAHTATMRANGTDKRGQGGAKATVVSTLAPHNGGTRVDVVTDYSITGRLARFGRGGMIEDISERLLRQFADCLQASLGAGAGSSEAAAGAGSAAAPSEGPAAAPSEGPAGPQSPSPGGAGGSQPPPPGGAAGAQPPPPSGEAISGLSLLASIAGERARRNPAAVAVVLGVVALLVLVLRRAKG